MLLALIIATAPVTPVKDVKAIVSAVQAGKGKVVVLKFWATWCGPCVEEFPAFLRTLKEFPDVVIVSVSADEKAEHVTRFADRNGIPFATLLLDGVEPDAMTAAIDKKWDGTLPAVFVYDREGKLSRKFIGPAKDLRNALLKAQG